MGQNLQYKIGRYVTPGSQDFCKFCSQKTSCGNTAGGQ